MYKKVIISILLNLSNFLTNSYLLVDTHYIKSMLDRNNVVNKGLWVRNRADIKNPRDFIFRANSLDVDSVLQNNFDAFGDNNVQNSPFLTSYVERNKRSLNHISTTPSYIKRDINNTVVIPRRKHNYKYELIKDSEYREINNTDVSKKDLFRSVFDKEDIAWQNSAPISNTNAYKVIPKSQENIKNKPITERGIIKVLSILTKTFKKIMKQHNDIKRIHKKLNNLSDNFVKNVEELTNKFEDFDSKYSQIMKVDQELKQVLAILKDKEHNFLVKEKEMTKNLIEFENQQKKFLAQQKQFYNIQNLMLAQNEKINLKQNIIAKTQSEISHRQNNFARILKKAKQIYIDTKNSPNKLDASITKTKVGLVKEKIEPANDATTVPTTESVKINLFAIPTTSGIKNQDQILMKEKDEHTIDDLILKYYFNNTFLDAIMKSKILSAFLNEETPKNTKKIKRNQIKLNSTILLPVNKLKKGINIENKMRQRRWIKRTKKNVHKNVKITTSIPKTNIKENIVETGNAVPINKIISRTEKGDPFMAMALSFCKEIGQDNSLQSINWCVEKTLRRLQVIGLKMASITPPLNLTEKQNSSQNGTLTTSRTVIEKMSVLDNDELENKLKEYELQPDPEGTVYYDGSLHSSDLGPDSDGFSDIMPGLDSDSRVQVDPIALDLQSQRRASVRKINERILKMKFG
ncbi:merozoite surface protein 1-like [Melitaea cinxia]|uniref:merozoite surface protein 1-like n=1 Tax=Melitaea cinxia TaxID=113334 RepID=UPI001E26FF8B|nr:merozoite surface protein 1-like [Melitaea cinxia]